MICFHLPPDAFWVQDDFISFAAFCILGSGGLGFTMAAKVKLFRLEQDGDKPHSMGKINSKEDESYAGLRERLEKSGAIPWPFEFWDAEEEERIGVLLEGLNTYSGDVYVVKKGSGASAGRKRCCVGDEEGCLHCSVEVAKDVAHLPETNTVSTDGGPPRPSASSRVNGGSNGETVEGLQAPQWLTSSLIAAEVMEKYLEFERKTRKELRNHDMEDHNWVLISQVLRQEWSRNRKASLFGVCKRLWWE